MPNFIYNDRETAKKNTRFRVVELTLSLYLKKMKH